MIAISSPRREDTFPSSLVNLPRSSSDVNLPVLKSSFSLQAHVSPSSTTPRSVLRSRSNKRTKLSRSRSLGGEIVYSMGNMNYLDEDDEREEFTVPDDSEDENNGTSVLTRTDTTSTCSLSFQITEGSTTTTTNSPTTLSTYTLSTKSIFEELEVPKNFSMVWRGVYRSSFPAASNFSYLKMLKLKTILTLIPEKYPQSNVEFMQSNGIQHIQIGIAANKEPFVDVPLDKITQAVSVILDKRNHPILIHCNKGKHRTGCIVGCLRKMQKWSLSNVFDEYRRFSYPKERVLDEQVIELWDEAQLLSMAKTHGWISV